MLGDLVTPAGILHDGAMDVREGQIVAMGVALDEERAAEGEILDARGRYVLPGAVDAHVHCFSESAEGFQNATAAAAVGGVTTIVEMPYDADRPVVDVERFEEKRAEIVGSAHVDVALLGTIRKVGGTRAIGDLVKAGACGFKVSTFETNALRFPRIGAADLVEAFGLIADAGLTVCVHAEDGEIISANVDRLRAEGRTDARAHGESRPPVSECVASAFALELARESGVKLHICHASLPRVIDIVTSHKVAGQPVSVETCPHYLLLTEDDVDRLGALGKINPPLRDGSARDALWARVADGSIDLIASDHAPWRLSRKQEPVIFDNASGAPGVETLVPLMLHHGVAGGRITLPQAMRLLAEEPAQRFGFAEGRVRWWSVRMPTSSFGTRTGARWCAASGCTPRHDGRLSTEPLCAGASRPHTCGVG